MNINKINKVKEKESNKINPLYWGKLDTISSVKFKNLEQLKKVNENFLTSSVAPFVGRYGYPNVNLGILTPPETRENAQILDDQIGWSQNKLDIPEIIDHRSQLLNSRSKTLVSKTQSKLLELAQEIALSKRSVDTEIHLDKKPEIRMNTDPLLPPFAANASLKSARLTENATVPTKVEKVVNDDIKAADALAHLSKSFDEHYLSKILSVGTLGVRKDRKLVPTRWSITATDDTLGKSHIEDIREYNIIEDYELYFGGYLGNYYAIILIPEVWSYELFEIYAGDIHAADKSAGYKCGKGDFMTDSEFYGGRKDYASHTVGGYYAARLAITERLMNRKRQASILALRFITDEYTTPLGVWVCRESTRESMKNLVAKFGSQELILDFVNNKIKSKFGLDVQKYYKLSKILFLKSSQKKLGEFV